VLGVLPGSLSAGYPAAEVAAGADGAGPAGRCVLDPRAVWGELADLCDENGLVHGAPPISGHDKAPAAIRVSEYRAGASWCVGAVRGHRCTR